MTKGDSIRTKPTAELMAEVRALAMRGASGQPSESSTSSFESQELKAQVSRFNDNGYQDYDDSSENSGKWKRNGKGGKGNFGKSSKNSKKNRNNGRKPSYDPNKYCSVHQRVGYDIFKCRKMARDQKGGRNGGNSDAGNGNGDNGNNGSRQTRSETYQPSFVKPSYPYSANTINHIINVPCLIDVNNTEMSDLSISAKEDSD